MKRSALPVLWSPSSPPTNRRRESDATPPRPAPVGGDRPRRGRPARLAAAGRRRPQRQHFREDIADIAFPRDDLAATCGFPIVQTNIGTAHGWFIETADGTFVADNVHLALDGQFINPANGMVVSFVIRQNIRSAEGADGSSEVVITGVHGKVRIPGDGVIAATLGRLTLSFPPDGGEPTVTFTGTDNEAEFFGSPGDPGILCDMLA